MTALSVIVTFYDETAFLRAAVDSVRGQGIDDLQIVVVNDNPERFSDSDLRDLIGTNRVDIIAHSQNLGLSAARNTGLAAARGAYVAFLDADDYFIPAGLSQHLAYAQSTQADMVHAPTYFTPSGSTIPRVLPRDTLYFCTQRRATGLKKAEDAQFITSSWSSLYRRDFITEKSLRFDVEQRKFEDRLFVLSAVTQARSLAFFGQPTRVWRGRAGSISSSPTSPDIHLLQIQLLEKCEALMRAEVAQNRLPARFAKRELFNTLSRLIWDLDVVPAILENKDPIYSDLAARIPALLGDTRFGQQIFEDPVLAPISRVGMKTRKGRIRRADFFEIHKHLRQGNFAAAQDIITAAQPAPPSRPTPKRLAKRLILHLGMHKTGSTFLQHQLQTHRPALLKNGILFPETGLLRQDNPLRPGAMAGHQGLIGAIRKDDPVPWAALGREIRAARADTVILSAENMLFPTDPNRETLIPKLLDNLSGFDRIELVALVRRPDEYLEYFWREWVADGAPSGAQTLETFLVDHTESLTDLPALFSPFEHHLGSRVQFLDYESLRKQGLWKGFSSFLNLPAGLPEADTPHYPTPDRTTTEALRLINTILNSGPRRRAVVRTWLNLHPEPLDKMSLLPPDVRAGLIEVWREKSADFAAARGVTPDLTISANWTPFEGLNADRLAQLTTLLAQDTQPQALQTTLAQVAPQARPRPEMSVTFQLRPWAANIVRRIKRRPIF
jgi:glycosyltransferase involved in cell wall biosynthesis